MAAKPDSSDRQEAYIMKVTDQGKRVIVVGTRQSALALTQSGQVIDELKLICEKHGFDYTFEVKKL